MATAPGISPSIGASPLDGPPPSPTPMGGGTQGPFNAQGLADPQPGGPGAIPSGQLPPQILTGIGQAAQSIVAMLDSFAQVTPDKAARLGLIKELLAQYLAEITSAGGGPVSSTAPGPAFPGGGTDRGIAGPGSV